MQSDVPARSNGPARLTTVGLDDPSVAPLLAGLSGEYERRYGPTDVMSDAAAAQFEAPHGMFVIGRYEDTTVAGGGFRRIDAATCEVKRMWTAPAHRRRGHARRVLAALEERARQAGYRRILLETGPAQPEAIAMYEDRGYVRIPPYGRYVESVAYERLL